MLFVSVFAIAVLLGSEAFLANSLKKHVDRTQTDHTEQVDRKSILNLLDARKSLLKRFGVDGKVQDHNARQLPVKENVVVKHINRGLHLQKDDPGSPHRRDSLTYPQRVIVSPNECRFYTLDMCDGQNDCIDGYDELLSTCLAEPCEQNEYKCGSGSKKGRCLLRSQLCDGYSDCNEKWWENEDSLDEDPYMCLNIPCYRDDDFMCPLSSDHPGKCVYRILLCDGYDNCGGNADESAELCQANHCGPDYIEKQCRNGQCYYTFHECNGVDDCGDGTDEDPAICN